MEGDMEWPYRVIWNRANIRKIQIKQFYLKKFQTKTSLCAFV